MVSSDNGGGIYPRGFSLTNDWPWPLVKAGDLVALNYGKALRDPDRTHGDIPVYGTNGRCGWHDRPLMRGPGVILGRKGQGPLGVEWCDGDFWVIDTA
jgi:type I restriction enzyme S subunit